MRPAVLNLQWIIQRMICGCVASVVLFTSTSIATLQSAGGSLPEAISIARLGEYADSLLLSAAQRNAAESMLLDYQRAYQEEARQASINGGQGGDGETWTFAPRSHWRQQQDHDRFAAALDERFFDSVAAILSAEQSERLPRVRMARERERLMQVKGIWSTPRPFDLSAAIARLALPNEQLVAIDDIMLEYEQSLTNKLRAYVQAQYRSVTQQYDGLERLGFDDRRILDPASAAELADALEDVVAPAAASNAPKRFADALEILELNRRTLASLQSRLPSQDGRWIHAELLKAVYGTLKSAIHARSPYDIALDRSDLTANQRATLIAEADAFHERESARIREMTDRIDAHREKYESDIDAIDQADAEQLIRSQARGLMMELNQSRAIADERVSSIVGDVGGENLNDDVRLSIFADEDAGVLAFGASLMPPAIAQIEIAEYARRLNLQPDDLQALDAAHRIYVDRCSVIDSRERKSLAQFAALLRVGATSPTHDAVEQFDKAQSAAMAALRAADDEFFAAVRAALALDADDVELERVRLARKRQWFSTGRYGGLRHPARSPGGAMESVIDISSLIFRLREIADDQRSPEASQTLMEYEKSILPLLEQRHEIVRDTQRLGNKLNAIMASVRATRTPNSDDARALDEEYGLERLRTAAIAVNNRIVELNRSTMVQLCRALAPQSANALQSAYDSLSWPRISRDPAAASAYIERAMRLADLAAHQSADIENIAAQYQAAYSDLRERMILSVERPDSPAYAWVWPSPAEEQAMAERAQERNRLTFERYELNMRVWQRLRRILTEEQVMRAGLRGLPPDAPNFNDDFGR